MCRGFSLLELVCALGLMAVGVSVLLPAARSVDDHLAVVAAREELIGLIVRARGAALVLGGATVVVEARPPRAWTTDGRTIQERVDLWDRHRAELMISGGRPRVELDFDATGLGTMAGRSITVRRGVAMARLVVSSYGRIRRE